MSCESFRSPNPYSTSTAYESNPSGRLNVKAGKARKQLADPEEAREQLFLVRQPSMSAFTSARRHRLSFTNGNNGEHCKL